MKNLAAVWLAVAAMGAGAQGVCAAPGAGDGKVAVTAAIQKALDACAGKGSVVLGGAPVFVSGPLRLPSHTQLSISPGTTLQGSDDHGDYAEMEQFGEKGLTPLLLAKDADDVQILGHGTIDGRGASWWEHRGPGELRPRLVVFDHVKHVVVEDVTVKNSPMWQIVPYYSEDVTFRNMKILAPATDGHNTDGIDPFSSKHVLIDHVTIDTGDDNIAIKSGQPGSAGPDAPSEDIHIVDCTFLHGHGLSVGSELSGGVKGVLAERVTFRGTTQGIRIKSGRDRGNDIGGLVFRDITMMDVGTAIQITAYYGSPKGTSGANADKAAVTRLTPHFHDITMENVTVTGAKLAMVVDGLPEAPIQSVRLKNVKIQAEKGALIQQATVVSEGMVILAKTGPPVAAGPGARGSLK